LIILVSRLVSYTTSLPLTPQDGLLYLPTICSNVQIVQVGKMCVSVTATPYSPNLPSRVASRTSESSSSYTSQLQYRYSTCTPMVWSSQSNGRKCTVQPESLPFVSCPHRPFPQYKRVSECSSGTGCSMQ
jgi:hypothetical protein